MRKPMPTVKFDLLKAVQIKLADKAFESMVTEIEWNYLYFHFCLGDDIDHGGSFVPANDF
jgi:hypothetical protein